MAGEITVVVSGPNRERSTLTIEIPDYPRPSIDPSELSAAITIAGHPLRRAVEKVLREHASVPQIRELEAPGISSALASDILSAVKDWLEE